MNKLYMNAPTMRKLEKEKPIINIIVGNAKYYILNIEGKKFYATRRCVRHIYCFGIASLNYTNVSRETLKILKKDFN